MCVMLMYGFYDEKWIFRPPNFKKLPKYPLSRMAGSDVNPPGVSHIISTRYNNNGVKYIESNFNNNVVLTNCKINYK